MTTSLLYALALGLPVITTRHSGFTEQVVDGENGFIVPPGDYEALARSIIYYCEHEELWQRFGRAGRERVVKRYDSKKLIQKQIELYESLMV